MPARFELFDLSILRTSALADVARGTLFLYGGELVKRFTINDHETWAPLSGPKAMLVHEFAHRRRSDVVAVVQALDLHVSMRPLSPLLELCSVQNPFGHALIRSNGIALGASGVEDDVRYAPGRIAIDIVGQESGFHESDYALAVAEWSIEWRDRFGNVALRLERTAE